MADIDIFNGYIQIVFVVFRCLMMQGIKPIDLYTLYFARISFTDQFS